MPVRETPAPDKSLDLDLKNAVARGKRERKAMLQQVRQRRALMLKRLAARGGR